MHHRARAQDIHTYTHIYAWHPCGAQWGASADVWPRGATSVPAPLLMVHISSRLLGACVYSELAADCTTQCNSAPYGGPLLLAQQHACALAAPAPARLCSTPCAPPSPPQTTNISAAAAPHAPAAAADWLSNTHTCTAAQPRGASSGASTSTWQQQLLLLSPPITPGCGSGLGPASTPPCIRSHDSFHREQPPASEVCEWGDVAREE